MDITFIIYIHDHTLLYNYSIDKWKCNLNKLMMIGCEEMEYETKHQPGPNYLCKICDYKICMKCCKKYKEDNKDNILEIVKNTYNILNGTNLNKQNLKIFYEISKIKYAKNKKPNMKYIYDWIIEAQNNNINIEESNLENTDLSKYCLNISQVCSFLIKYKLTGSNTYQILEFMKKHKKEINLMKEFSYRSLLNNENLENFDTTGREKYKNGYLCLSYSWKENLYCLLNEINGYSFIWIDIFCVNQLDEKLKQKGLDQIEYAYSNCLIYFMTKESLKRYWCTYELSVFKKKMIEFHMINKTYIETNNDFNKIYLKFIEKMEYFNDKHLKYKTRISIMRKFYFKAIKYLDFKEKFVLKEAKITFENDREYIEKEILKKYKKLKHFELEMNCLLIIIIFGYMKYDINIISMAIYS